MNHRYLPISARRRHGIIFVTALGVCVILMGLALVFTDSMRTEAIGAANRMSYAEADSIEQAAEQYVLANVDEYTTDAMSLTTDVPAQAVPVGDGFFWIIKPNDTTDQDWDFGIVDEDGKININYAPSAMLDLLPDMTQDAAGSIWNWHNGNPQDANGVDTTYYSSLPEQYEAKAAPFESVEELLLVEGMTPQLLYGQDLNRNGVVDDNERNAGGTLTFTTGETVSDSRGIFPFITTYGPNPANSSTAARAPTGGRGGRGGVAVQTQTLVVNINTANTGTLETLLQYAGNSNPEAEATSIVQQRQGQDYTDTSWLSQVDGSLPNTLATFISGQSYQYSADIVAVSHDGRAFKRVRIVVDCTPATTTGTATTGVPTTTLTSKIVYRRDLTNLGWPLPQQVRDALKSGEGITPGQTLGYGGTGSQI